MDVNFAEIQTEFNRRISQTVWATVTTINLQGRPRSRILHPIWEGSTGWIATGRQSFKAKHIAQNPFISVSYWDQQHQQVLCECKAQWQDDADEKARLWDYFGSTPAPLGYDLTNFWTSPKDETYGLLKLTPWRIELSALADMVSGKEALVYRQDVA